MLDPLENIETNGTDRYRPYPECLCCYCIKILLTEPSYSCQEKTLHDKSQTHVNNNNCHTVVWVVVSLVGQILLVHWQPPDGSRLASDIEMSADVKYYISYNSRG